MTHDERAQRRREIAVAIATGKAVDEVCQTFGVSWRLVYDACYSEGVKLPDRRAMKRSEPSESAFAILGALFNSAETYREIGHRFGVTHQRVHQIRKMALDNGIPVPPRGTGGNGRGALGRADASCSAAQDGDRSHDNLEVSDRG